MDSAVRAKSNSLFGEKEPGGGLGVYFGGHRVTELLEAPELTLWKQKCQACKPVSWVIAQSILSWKRRAKGCVPSNCTASWYRLGTLWWGVGGSDRAAGRQGFQREAELA